MKTKILLPVLAIIFAVGMAFASIKLEMNANNDYIHLGGDSWQPIPEIPCQTGTNTCTVQLTEGGPIFTVYDEPDLSTEKKNNSNVPYKLY